MPVYTPPMRALPPLCCLCCPLSPPNHLVHSPEFMPLAWLVARSTGHVVRTPRCCYSQNTERGQFMFPVATVLVSVNFCPNLNMVVIGGTDVPHHGREPMVLDCDLLTSISRILVFDGKRVNIKLPVIPSGNFGP